MKMGSILLLPYYLGGYKNMSVKKIRGANTDTPYNYGVWLVDNDADLSSLPTDKNENGNGTTTSIGSKAYVFNTNKKYILNNSSQWVDVTGLVV